MFVIDEPYIKGANKTEMKNYLVSIGDEMNRTLPSSVRTAINFMGRDVNSRDLPMNYDLYGFDQYGTNYASGTANKLISLIPNSARIFLVPGSFNGSGYGFSEAQLIEQLRQAHAYAIQQPKVEAIFPFLYQSFNPIYGRLTGARNLSHVREEGKRIGAVVTGKITPPVAPVITVPTVVRPVPAVSYPSWVIGAGNHH